jgi:hypothetical protein
VLAFARPVVGKERAAVGLFAAGQSPDLKAVYDTLGSLGGGAGQHDQRAHGVRAQCADPAPTEPGAEVHWVLSDAGDDDEEEEALPPLLDGGGDVAMTTAAPTTMGDGTVSDRVKLCVPSPRHKYPDRNPDLAEIYYVFESWYAEL